MYNLVYVMFVYGLIVLYNAMVMGTACGKVWQHVCAHLNNTWQHVGDLWPLFGWHYWSKATCLISMASFVLCVVRHVKDHHDVIHYSIILKKSCVRRVVLQKWFPLPSVKTPFVPTPSGSHTTTTTTNNHNNNNNTQNCYRIML